MSMTRAELTALCATWPDTFEDYPFEDPNWTAMRHQSNRRIFALVYEREGRLRLNLKCEPMRAEFWRKVYPCVVPGFHMNKQHWNTLTLGDLPNEEILHEMIGHSWELTRPKVRKKH